MMIADYENKEKFRDDETLSGLLAMYDAQNAETHIVEELARHAGQADIIRESIDSATMYELLFVLDNS